MSQDISSKLQSLKVLRTEMKDWKKDDIRTRKGIAVKTPEPTVQEQQKSVLEEVLARLSK